MSEENYSTSDLWVTSFLLCKKAELLSNYQENGRVVYVFQDKGECENLEQEFLVGKATVVAKEFVDAFRAVKSLIYRIR